MTEVKIRQGDSGLWAVAPLPRSETPWDVRAAGVRIAKRGGPGRA